MKARSVYFIFPIVLLLLIFTFAGCGKSENEERDSVISYAGSMPVGDFIVIHLDRAGSLVRHINYTTGEDSGWLPYTSVAASHEDAQGFSILKRVELPGGNYVLFAEFPNTALTYQEFDSTGTTVGWPV
ncbi:MAG: hypothetical protein JXN64_09650 [Spirochaetes bacterium]|nr:hypothetical protein [Spirochaetota bacterium]